MSHLPEPALHYPHGEHLPPVGASIEVAPGVRWLRMPLPFALDHINLWLLRDVERSDSGRREGWTVVDCGIDSAPTREAWERIFDTELDGLPVLRVIVTHMHPDHMGLAHWLTGRWSTPEHACRLWISATDWHAARLAVAWTTGFGGDAAAAFFASHGLVDEGTLASIRQRSGHYASLVPDVPARFRRLTDGMRLRIGGHEWQCIAGHGHAPEHIALHRAADDLLISGDMVLPRISTNVSVVDTEPEADPLRLYLQSISELRSLPAQTIVLPSHGRPFTGLHARIDQLHAHHDERLADVMSACGLQPCSAADLLPVLFRRPLDLHQTAFAIGEAIAHLHALWHDGRLRRTLDGGGVYRFAAD